jgi:hypothetical protein
VQTEVPVEGAGGTYLVPVSINDTITLKFTIDSGASDVAIPADVVSTLFRAGTITREDFIGRQTFAMADGSTVPSDEFRIRSLKVGTLVLHDVVGSISDPKGPLLLGQSFLSRLANWSFDNQRHILSLKAAPGEAELAAATTTPTQTPQVDADSRGATGQAALESGAATIALNYMATWSDPRDPDGQQIRPFYGETVNFYGSEISQDQLMEQKLQFARRWPIRSYVVRADSVSVRCTDAHRCFVAGIVDWSAANEASGRRSAGSATFAMMLNDGLIERETGSVITRQ